MSKVDPTVTLSRDDVNKIQASCLLALDDIDVESNLKDVYEIVSQRWAEQNPERGHA
jgi:hypothetical protein